MNKMLETLRERIDARPEEAKEELIRSVIEIEAKDVGLHHLSEEERAAVRRGLEEMRQGRFATDEEVAAVFNRYRS